MRALVLIAVLLLAACDKGKREPKPRWLHEPNAKTWGQGCGPVDHFDSEGASVSWTAKSDSPTRIAVNCWLTWTSSGREMLRGISVATFGKTADRNPVDLDRYRKAVVFALNDMVPHAHSLDILDVFDQVRPGQGAEFNVGGFDVEIKRNGAVGRYQEEFSDHIYVNWAPWHATL